MAITIQSLLQFGGGNPVQIPHPEDHILHISIDSREKPMLPGTMFVALEGTRDGHQFILDAVNARDPEQKGGAAHLLCKKAPPGIPAHVNVIEVPDPLHTLQILSASIRTQCTAPVIGITGSNGKTIVKEWLHQLVSDHYTICKSPRSYNSQVGVPISVWELRSHHTLAIFEAGISKVGEMQRLASIIQPDIGIFTHFGDAHNEGFSSPQQKLEEKLKLFASCKTLIFRNDDAQLEKTIRNTYPDLHCFTWGYQSHAQVQILSTERVNTQTLLQVRIQDHAALPMLLPFVDESSIENAMHCVTACIALGLDGGVIAQKLKFLAAIPMRLEWKQGKNDTEIINDTYNADLTSLGGGLRFLQSHARYEKRMAILSDILQSGMPDELLYRQVGILCTHHKIDILLGVGTQIVKVKPYFTRGQFIHVRDTEAALAWLDQHAPSKISMFIKGARSFGFERLVNAYTLQSHRTVLEIDLKSIRNNILQFLNLCGPSSQLCVMVKASGYGSGSIEIGRLCEQLGVSYLGVAFADEGVTLRQAGISTPIIVFSPDHREFGRMYLHRLEPLIFDHAILQQWCDAIGGLDAPPPIHIKLDTGMHRLGFIPSDIEPMLLQLKKTPGIQVASICTHLASSEQEVDDAFTHEQVAIFQSGFQRISEALGYAPIRHVNNTNGMIRFPQYQMDMSRLGIGIYGIVEEPMMRSRCAPTVTLKSYISQLKKIQPGETIGYNRRGKATEPLTIATLGIGYADGLNRQAGNGRLTVLCRGQLVPTIGNICMDMTMLDVTKLQEVKVGDEVIFFGKELDINHIANQLGTIPYEILSTISARIKRLYIQE